MKYAIALVIGLALLLPAPAQAFVIYKPGAPVTVTRPYLKCNHFNHHHHVQKCPRFYPL